ncbi:hypothetical protein EDD18DRAFT_645706 [Armillaria luteobubalina]|uniref:Uncharacterized protein n=1 Tax=Armillaria luteobubalina TaxID=153913 RepID=A0AA39PQ86_9AGAR|nr:hypothetical protein EDD18DRAFT_645706 [Armillaria luteobubalina]
MATGTYPNTAIPELTDSQIKDIFENLDMGVNNTILCALLYGIYTGVVAVTLWAVASRNNCEDRRRPHFLVAIILLLYFLAAFTLYREWAGCITIFTTLAWKSVWEIWSLGNGSTSVILTGEVTALLSTVLADATLIWRCWIVWGRSWRVVLVPIACTTLATASRGIVAYYDTFGPLMSPQASFLQKAVNWAMLYASLVMATLLWCTILIIYRILRAGGTAGRLRVFQRVIEMLVESAALYSTMIVILLVFEARNEVAAIYIEVLASAMRGIMPTMLVGRVAAGHARPDDSWSEGTPRSSIRFGNYSASQNDTEMSVGSGRVTSSTERTDPDEGLEISTVVRVEGASPIDITHDYYHVVRTSNSVNYGIV